jgi:arylsulfatase A-like enzyme
LHNKSIEDRDLFWRYRNQKVARHKEWKLLLSDKDTLLINLNKDVLELHNLSKERPEIVKDLLKKLEAWEKEVGPVTAMKTI